MAENPNSPPICPGEYLTDADEKKNLENWFRDNQNIPMETKSTMAFYDVQNPIAEKDYVAIVKNVTSIKHIRCILDLADNIGPCKRLRHNDKKNQVEITFENEEHASKLTKLLHWRQVRLFDDNGHQTGTVTLECYKVEVKGDSILNSDDDLSFQQLSIDEAEESAE